MTDLERRIRDALDDQARSAPQPHEPEPTLRRTRRRQALLVAGGTLAGFALVAASVIGVAAVTNLDGRRGGEPATGSTITTTINRISITHPDDWFVVDPDEVGLGSGRRGGELPRLLMMLSSRPVDETFGCPSLAEDDPPTLMMTVEQGPLMLDGVASQPWPAPLEPLAVEMLAQVEDNACYPAWEFFQGVFTTGGRSFDVRVGFAPEVTDADRQALLDAYASLEFAETSDPPTSVVLASGVVGDEGWELVASRGSGGLDLGVNATTGGAGVGGLQDATSELLLGSLVVGSGSDQRAVVFGAVPADIVVLNLELDDTDDAIMATDVLDVPDDLDAEFNAFYYLVMPDAAGEIRAYDDAGNLIASGRFGGGGEQPNPPPPSLASPVGTPPPSLPDEVLPEHGGRFWGLYLAVAETVDDPQIERWVQRMESIGYTPSFGDLACDDGAASTFGVPPEWFRVAVYFGSREDAETAAGAISISLGLGEPVGITHVTTYCLD